jgi:hypothetical protein
MPKIWIPLLVVTAITGAAVTTGRPGGTAPANASTPVARTSVAASGPVVAELFTSQGCSSCPPADAVAARLARDPAILVISRPVTYWDRLGWKDSLGREENTRLQRQYGDTAFAGANIYTPQLVIDGTTQGVGSQEAKVRGLIAKANAVRAGNGVAVRVTRTADGARSVALSGGPGDAGDLVLVALSSSETVEIRRGENGGRSILYTNVVIDEKSLGRWKGGKQAINLPSAMLDTPGADRHALIVRRGPGRAVIGSAVL